MGKCTENNADNHLTALRVRESVQKKKRNEMNQNNHI